MFGTSFILKIPHDHIAAGEESHRRRSKTCLIIPNKDMHVLSLPLYGGSTFFCYSLFFRKIVLGLAKKKQQKKLLKS